MNVMDASLFEALRGQLAKIQSFQDYNILVLILSQWHKAFKLQMYVPNNQHASTYI